MKLIRLFSSDNYKGEKNYLNKQRGYELARTLLLFSLSAALYLIGYFTTNSNKNVLTIIAVLGCLPACKSLVNTIMFIRYKSCDKQISDRISENCDGLCNMFDAVFTSSNINFVVNHLVVNKGSILCFAEKYGNKVFNEEAFIKHINTYLKAEGIKDITIKVFYDEKKYIDRISNIEKNKNTEKDNQIIRILKSISL